MIDGVLMEFLHLGNIINRFPPFSADGNFTALLLDKPTISPRDPNFPGWWEEYKKEWSEPEKAGQEPADE